MNREFDFESEGEAKDEAIERAYQASLQAWRNRALAAVMSVSKKKREFISDDVWQELEAKGCTFKPREPRALGGVMMRAARAGYIRKIGNAPSARKGCHQNLTSVWTAVKS